MSVVNTKSTAVTNADATPVDLTGAYLSNGRLRESVGTVETANGDSVASVYRVARIPSHARVSQILLYSDDIGTTTIADLGLYQTAANGGAVVDADLFASAVSLKDGALSAVDVTHESAVFDIAHVERRLWEALGLTADPKVWYDVAFTLTGAADAAGTITAKIRYVDGT